MTAIRKFIIVIAGILLAIGITFASPREDFEVMVHSAHPIWKYKVSFDEKYLYSLGANEICVWDLRSRMLIACIPSLATDLRPHPLDSKLIYILSPVGEEEHKRVVKNGMAQNDLKVFNWQTGEVLGYVNPEKGIGYEGVSNLQIASVPSNFLVLAPIDFSSPAKRLGNYDINPGSVRANDDGSRLITSGMFPCVWNLRTATLDKVINYYSYLKGDTTLSFGKNKFMFPYGGGAVGNTNFVNAYFEPNSNNVLITGTGDKMTRWSSEGGLIEEIPVGAQPSTAISRKGDIIIAASHKGIHRKIGNDSFKELKAFSDQAGNSDFFIITPPYQNDKFLVACPIRDHRGATVLEGSFNSERPTRILSDSPFMVKDIKLSPRGDYAAMVSHDEVVSFIDLTSPSLRYLRHINLPQAKFSRCEILPDESLVVGSTDGSLYFFDKDKNRTSRIEHDHTNAINTISLSADSKRMFISDRSGKVSIWDTKTKKPIMYLYSINGGNDGYLFLTPDHYYKTTPEAYKYINFISGGKPYAFEQFDLRNNRPDIVAERLGADPELVDILRKSWEKRLRRAGINASSLAKDYHAPTCTVTNADRLQTTTKSPTVPLEIVCNDTKYPLKDIVITLNGVPLEPKSTIRTSHNGRRMELQENLKLASGQNEIVVTCHNTQGTESLRETININYSNPSAKKPDIYLVTIGVSDYADKAFNLSYATTDANDFASLIKSQVPDGDKRVKSLSITDTGFIRQCAPTISEFISKASRDDIVILFYAGHGVLNSALDYFLATHNMDFSKPETKGIAYDDFVDLLKDTESVNRYCFIDACHSGAIDKEDYMAVNTEKIPAGEELVFRGAGQLSGAKADVDKVNKLINEMFVDIKWGNGVTVLSSAGGAELSVESSRWKNGLFTYCLKKGLETGLADSNNDGHVTLSELIEYTTHQVSTISEGKQSPTVRTKNRYTNLILK